MERKFNQRCLLTDAVSLLLEALQLYDKEWRWAKHLKDFVLVAHVLALAAI